MKNKFKISREVLLQLANNNSYSEEILKKECPKLFESELEVGKWYKGTYLDKKQDLIFITIINNENNIIGYGVNYEDNWFDCRNTHYHYGKSTSTKDWTLATPQEVETALINEAKKRGYKKGIEVVDIYNGKTKKDTTTISSNNFDYEIIKAGGIQSYMALRDSDGNIIFHNGTWATIIETPTDIITIVEKYGKDKVISLIEKM